MVGRHHDQNGAGVGTSQRRVIGLRCLPRGAAGQCHQGNAYVNAVRQKAGLPPMPPDYSAGPGGYGGGTGAGGNIITR